MNEVVERLKKMISEKLLEEQPFDWDNVNTSPNLASLHGELSLLIKKFNDMNTNHLIKLDETTRFNPNTSLPKDEKDEKDETNEIMTSSKEVRDLNDC